MGIQINPPSPSFHGEPRKNVCIKHVVLRNQGPGFIDNDRQIEVCSTLHNRWADIQRLMSPYYCYTWMNA